MLGKWASVGIEESVKVGFESKIKIVAGNEPGDLICGVKIRSLSRLLVNYLVNKLPREQENQPSADRSFVHMRSNREAPRDVDC